MVTAVAAPLPWGIAINNATRECAGFWGGDEFYGYNLPAGWEAYYPDYANDVVPTPFGNCTWEYDREQACCGQLGLPFVSDNIGEGFDTGFGTCEFFGNCTCVEEGRKVFYETQDKCCEGLEGIPSINDNGTPTLDEAYCTKCGDSECKPPENIWNCPEDCQEKECQINSDCSGANEICVSHECKSLSPPVYADDSSVSTKPSGGGSTMYLMFVVLGVVLAAFALFLVKRKR